MLFAGAVLLAVFVLERPWDVVALAVAAIVEVGETLFWIRLSRRGRPRVGPEALVGARAEVVSACRPVGQVRIQGELWRARSAADVDRGEAVRIAGIEGLTLLVEPEADVPQT